MEKRKTIAIFDSGIGGLTLLKDCYLHLQGVNFIYLADNGNMPYGNKCELEIFQKTKVALQSLSAYSIDALVLACNTVTAICVEKLREDSALQYPIFGIEPAILPALQNVKEEKKSILLLATNATLQSKRVQKLLQKYNINGQIVCNAPRELASMIEKNILQLDRVDWSQYLPEGEFDSVILGCTHYIHIQEYVQMHFQTRIFDGNIGTVNHIRQKLLNMKKNGNFVKNTVQFIGKQADFNAKIFKNMLEESNKNL